jgi:hypothetical protein
MTEGGKPMTVAILLSVAAVVAIGGGGWLVLARRQLLPGALALAAGAVLLLLALAWPASVVFEGDPSDTAAPPPRLVPTVSP